MTRPETALAALVEALTALPLLPPAQRDRAAVALLDVTRRALAEVRRQAAREARADGVRPADYARQLGISRGAVDHLLRTPPT